MMSFVLAATFAGCSDIDDQNPAGFVITDEQKSQTVEAIPERVKADLAGMYTMMGKMGTYFGEDANGTQPRDDDGGYPSVCLSNDLNGPDMVSENSGYNWFSVASEYTDRTPYQEPATLEYSEMKKTYRFTNILLGQSFTFSVDEDNNIVFGPMLPFFYPFALF